ncbi:MAG: rhodanese-like domain-containing protein [Longibaculum sp.]
MNNVIQPEMIYQIIDNPHIYFVDIRDNFQYDKLHLKNFINIPEDQFLSQLSMIPKDKMICLICYSGKKTERLAKELCQLGYLAYYIDGGFQAFLNIHNEKYF